MSGEGRAAGPGSAGRVAQAMETVNARLRERVGDLEALLEVAPVGIVYTDSPDCREIVVNDHGARIMGIQSVVPPAGAGAPYRYLRDGRELPAEELPLETVWRSGRPVHDFRATYAHDNGTRFELIMAATPVFDGEGRIRRVIAVFDDITRMVEAQADAERRVRQQDYVAKLGTRSLRGESFDELLARLPVEVAEVLSADFVKVLEYRPASNDFLLRASFGFATGPAAALLVPGGNRSQAGVALESGQPIFVQDLPSDPRFVGPELLVSHGVRSGLSVAIGDVGWPLGVIGVHSREIRSFDEHDVQFLQAVANVLAATIQRDETARHQEVLLAELQHRVKNSLATVQAIASLSFRNTTGIGADLQVFRDRIRALSAAHDLLFRTGWRAIELAQIVRSQLGPFQDRTNRIIVEGGGPVALSSNEAMEMGMVLHELATNAAKYGALSSEAGGVRIAWSATKSGAGRRLVFDWRESGGPPVSPPATRGIGTTLIASAFHGLRGASVDLAFEPEGVTCRLDLPIGRDGRSAASSGEA
ncbi:Two-component sensor histidine kinase, contains HisKA and HATPase domains [Tistlia consotensis]|uniref:histidine kinase n=1 Tax=Tistlia consotensis USBA 355 TaxID=560819 RepID=A0A1Y6BBX2_9PROT|nr:HWE histidine kinase domain-containing protein [Tistlia consotensis]SMF02136.1 Two-component sensor histidine kinase, contains HisKA and HATPase domains [Tistlia consotensis USBA 355]SNS26351.1 Two-component sensor histidine kinase, contains HisKA and HATPase domains [Tistlia consotensis]